nr:hypothetical protein CFP56_37286 [Quercus suber]
MCCLFEQERPATAVSRAFRDNDVTDRRLWNIRDERSALGNGEGEAHYKHDAEVPGQLQKCYSSIWRRNGQLWFCSSNEPLSVHLSVQSTFHLCFSCWPLKIPTKPDQHIFRTWTLCLVTSSSNWRTRYVIGSPSLLHVPRSFHRNNKMTVRFSNHPVKPAQSDGNVAWQGTDVSDRCREAQRPIVRRRETCGYRQTEAEQESLGTKRICDQQLCSQTRPCRRLKLT